MLRNFYRNSRHRWIKGWSALSDQTDKPKQWRRSRLEEKRLSIHTKSGLELGECLAYGGHQYAHNFNRVWLGNSNNFWEAFGLGTSIVLGIKYSLYYAELRKRRKQRSDCGFCESFLTLNPSLKLLNVIPKSFAPDDLVVKSIDLLTLSQLCLSQDIWTPLNVLIESENIPNSLCLVEHTSLDAFKSSPKVHENIQGCHEFSDKDNLASYHPQSSGLSDQSLISEKFDLLNNDSEIKQETQEGYSSFFDSQEVNYDIFFDSCQFNLPSSLFWKNPNIFTPFLDLLSLNYVPQIPKEKLCHDLQINIVQEIDISLGSYQFLSPDSFLQRTSSVSLQPALEPSSPKQELQRPRDESSHQYDVNHALLLSQVGDLVQLLVKITENMVVEEKCDVAAKLARKGEYKSAIKIWMSIVEKHPLHGKSLYNLAICYENGLGFKKSIDKATGLYKRAAEVDHLRSCYRLARIFLKEWRHGSDSSFQLSQKYYCKSVALGFQQAEKELEDLLNKKVLVGSKVQSRKVRSRTKTFKDMAPSQQNLKGLGKHESELRTNKFLEGLEINKGFMGGNILMLPGNSIICH